MLQRAIRFVACSVLAAGVPLVVAQPPAAPGTPAKPAAPAAGLPAGEALFAKHVEALGGMETLRAQKSALIKGRMIRPGGATGLITVWRKAPNTMYKIVDIPGQVTIETWCDGENAWVRNSNKGAARITGAALADTILEAEFIGEADYKARYKELVTKEKTTFGERPAYAVAALTSNDKPRTLFFDAEKGFLIGVEVPLTGGRGEGKLTITIGDYKKFGDTYQPTLLIEDNGRLKNTTEFTQIEMNVALMPSLDPPDEVKSLK
jgi:hypothetical protein